MSGARYLVSYALCVALFISHVSADQCDGLDDGTYLPAADNCADFFLCDGGLAWRLNCPGVLVWSVAETICDYPHSVECGQRPNGNATEAPEPEETVTDVPEIEEPAPETPEAPKPEQPAAY